MRVRAAPGAEAGIGDAAPAATPAAAIELVDCIARGEATFLRVEDLQPVRLFWDNGLLATSERLLVAVGGAKIPQTGELLQVDLRHLTAVTRGGLCRLAANQSGPHLLPAQISVADSILLGGPGSAMVEQVGDGEIDDFRERIAWTGDRNCYDGFDSFWTIDRLDPETPPDRMGFDAWKSHWGGDRENLPHAGPLAWRKTPPASRPMHRTSAADYALADEAENNPAVGAASDGGNIGLQATRLPEEKEGIGD